MKQMQMMKMLTMTAALALVVCSGCRQIIYTESSRAGHYYLNPRANFPSVGRVVLLELDNLSARQDLSESLTQTLADELSKRHLFSVQKVMRSEPIWQTMNLDAVKSHALRSGRDTSDLCRCGAVRNNPAVRVVSAFADRLDS